MPDKPLLLRLLREKLGRPELAMFLDSYGDWSLRDAASLPWQRVVSGAMDEDLRAAFGEALAEVASGPLAQRALEVLCRRRVLATASHVGVSQGPVLFGAHVMASVGAVEGEPLVVGAWSGIPFSNGSGCFQLGAQARVEDWLVPGVVLEARRKAWADRARDCDERRLRLVNAGWSDAPVWWARCDEVLARNVEALRPEVRELLGEPLIGMPYTSWALRACARLESAVLGRPVVMVDLGRVLCGYLRRVLERPGHPSRALLTDAGLREQLWGRLPRRALWTSWESGRGGRVRMKVVRDPLSLEDVVRGLDEGRLSPGVWVGFAILSVLHGIRCLGGVDQCEYLPRLMRVCKEAGWGGGEVFEGGLISGHCVEPGGASLPPLEIWRGRPWEMPGADVTVLQWLRPQWKRLLRRPMPWQV